MLIEREKGYSLPRKRKYAVAALIAFTLVAAAISIYELRFRLLILTAQYLVVDDRLEPADAIYLLNGDFYRRPYHAAELYRKGLAPHIVIARAEDSPSVALGITQNVTDLSIETLKKLGVADQTTVQLRPPGGVTSTYDEAIALRDYAVSARPHTIIIVTSEFHSRRSSRVFRRVLRGTGIVLLMSPVSDLKYTTTNWWRNEDGVLACQNEYLKLLFYKLHYGI
ncbi:MAG: YdcF family protein [Acidobacteriia bacterium]|nr:YdcF family protein [Terriglobia bacterium]